MAVLAGTHRPDGSNVGFNEGPAAAGSGASMPPTSPARPGRASA